MNHAQLQLAVMDALKASKPLTVESARQIAASTLESMSAGKEARDFDKWFDTHGGWLTERVNRA